MMFLFEEELDTYLENTAVFPHPKSEEEEATMAIKANTKTLQAEEKARLKSIYRALGLTAKGKFSKTAAQRRVEKLTGRERN